MIIIHDQHKFTINFWFACIFALTYLQPWALFPYFIMYYICSLEHLILYDKDQIIFTHAHRILNCHLKFSIMRKNLFHMIYFRWFECSALWGRAASLPQVAAAAGRMWVSLVLASGTRQTWREMSRAGFSTVLSSINHILYSMAWKLHVN